MAGVVKIDTDLNTAISTIGSFQYDYLVIVFGCKTNSFGNNEIMKNALSLKKT